MRKSIQHEPFSLAFTSSSFVNSKIIVPNSFNPTTSSFTLFTRVYIGYVDILGHWFWSQSGNTIFGVTSSTANNARFAVVVGGIGGVVQEFTTRTESSRWYSLALIFNHVTNDWNLYVDGVLDSTTCNCDVGNNTGNHWIGMHGTLAAYGLKGKLVGWHLLKRIATASEAQNWCYSGKLPSGDYDHSYSFSERSGSTLTDLSGNGYTGANGLALAWKANDSFGRERLIERNIANSLGFNGVSSGGGAMQVEAVETKLDDLFDSGGSFECWFWGKEYGGSNNGMIFGANTTCISYNTNCLRFQQGFSTTNGSWKIYDSHLELGQRWFHLVITYDNSLTTNAPIFYFNGAYYTPITSVTPVGTRTSYAGALKYIGNFSGYFNSWAGNIARPRFWNRILTADEIEDIYYKNITPTTGLVADFPMSEGSGTTLTDSYQGIQATLNGTALPTWSSFVPMKLRTLATGRGIAGTRGVV